MPSVVIIGTRTPKKRTFELAKLTAAFFADLRWAVRTGGAPGIDAAAIQGGSMVDPSLVWIYEPWPGFADSIAEPDNRHYELRKEWFDSIEQYHPAPYKLTRAGRKLHARNYGMIVHPTRADMVIAFPERGSGGTWQGIRIARLMKIPLHVVLNSNDEKGLVALLQRALGSREPSAHFHGAKRLVDGYPPGASDEPFSGENWEVPF